MLATKFLLRGSNDFRSVHNYGAVYIRRFGDGER